MKGNNQKFEMTVGQESTLDIIKRKDTKALSEHLEAGINDYLSSDVFKHYLNFIAKFHHYSSNNVRLLLAQNPKVRHVAGFHTWKKQERFVKKGETALYVFAPIITEKKDAAGKVIVAKNGEPEKDIRYILRPVFDVSQTKGDKPVPELLYNIEDDLNDPEFFPILYKALTGVIPETSVSIEAFPHSGNGYYLPDKNKIVLRKGLGQVMTVKTLLHEMAHALLHTNSQASFGDTTYRREEFEAESVAYVVSQHLGIDTSVYSFGYLASWTDNGHKLEELTQSLDVITKEASQLIERIDQSLDKVYMLDAPQNKFEERLAKVKKQPPIKARSPKKAYEKKEATKEKISKKRKETSPSSTSKRFGTSG